MLIGNQTLYKQSNSLVGTDNANLLPSWMTF